MVSVMHKKGHTMELKYPITQQIFKYKDFSL